MGFYFGGYSQLRPFFRLSIPSETHEILGVIFVPSVPEHPSGRTEFVCGPRLFSHSYHIEFTTAKGIVLKGLKPGPESCLRETCPLLRSLQRFENNRMWSGNGIAVPWDTELEARGIKHRRGVVEQGGQIF